MSCKKLLLKMANRLFLPFFIFFPFFTAITNAAESTMHLSGTSTSLNGITVSFSTGAFTGSSDGSAMSLSINHPYGMPINGGNDYKDITIAPASYIARVKVAWAVNTQGFILQFRHNNAVVKEITNFNAVGDIKVPTEFTVNQVVDVIRFLDAGVSNSGGFELSHITFSDPLPVYVDQSASGSNDGTSWANAYTSLQSALTSAVSGNKIWVAKGTYKPSSAYDLTNTPRYYHFRLKDGVEMYGGFAGTETDVSQRTDFAAGGVNETILSGDIGVADNHTDNCYHIFYHPSSYGLTSSTVLNGFTITYGYADDNTGASHLYRGGGMYNGSGNQPTIDQCIFSNNYAGYGGGLYNLTCSPSVSNCVFSSNTANNNGGGIYNTTSANPTITNCLVINNTAVATGGGIYSYATDIALDACNPVISNTTIANNNANLCGGVRVLVSTTTLNNCIIWGNTDINAGDGNQIYMTGTGSSTTLNNSCYSNGTNDVHGTVTTANCITTDPQFIGSGVYPFSICGTSPCADAGNNSYNAKLCDIRGAAFARKLNKITGAAGTIDMGAYEYKVGADVLPVEISSFTASSARGGVVLKWQTATEVNNYGFDVERKTSSAWDRVGFVQGSGTTNAQQSYTYVDNSASDHSAYRLKQIDRDGTFTYSQEVEVVSAAMPRACTLSQNYPNPFNPATVISYTIASAATVVLKVYDMLGREVAVLVNEQKEAGNYTVQFNASRLSSGLYMYRLDAGNFSDVKTLTIMK